MPSHKSAAKRDRQNIKRAERNTLARSAARTAVKKVREAIDAGKKEEAKKAFKEVTKKLSSAVSKGVVHQNNAARRISRLAVKVNRLG